MFQKNNSIFQSLQMRPRKQYKYDKANTEKTICI